MAIKREEIIGDARLLLGDCVDVMPTLGTFDAVVTDPPYGIGQAGGFSGAGGFSKPIKRREYIGAWDNRTPAKEVFDIIIDISSVQIIWGGNYFTDKLPVGAFWLAWNKENTMPTFSDGELAWTSIKKRSVKFFKYAQNGCIAKEKERFHPTQKAVAVMSWCLSHITAAKTILDPFMGSGTTGVAAVQEGRSFTGIELDEKYFNIACERIENAQRQGRLFT